MAKRPEDTVVVVTGATGRLGQRTISFLLEKGYQVRATDIKSERRPPSATELEVMGPLNGEFDVIVADMCDREAADKIIAGADALIHLGAIPGPLSHGAPCECTRRSAHHNLISSDA